jgi:hypothetical protein
VVPHFASWLIADVLSLPRVLGASGFVCLVEMVLINSITPNLLMFTYFFRKKLMMLSFQDNIHHNLHQLMLDIVILPHLFESD